MAGRHVLAVAMVFVAISSAACDATNTQIVGSASMAPSEITPGGRAPFVARLEQVPTRDQLAAIGCPAGSALSAPFIVVVQGDGSPGLFLSTVTFGMISQTQTNVPITLSETDLSVRFGSLAIPALG